jgi:hypothetical protein
MAAANFDTLVVAWHAHRVPDLGRVGAVAAVRGPAHAHSRLLPSRSRRRTLARSTARPAATTGSVAGKRRALEPVAAAGRARASPASTYRVPCGASRCPQDPGGTLAGQPSRGRRAVPRAQQISRPRGWKTLVVNDETTPPEPRGDNDLAVPTRSGLDTARGVVNAIAELDPTGIASAGAGLIRNFLPTGFERRRQEFYERLAHSIYELRATTRELNEGLAVAALAQGTLSAMRSASELHLEYLANATARAMATPEERDADHTMVLLRIAGDITATHIRLLQMYADPHEFAARVGKDFEWVRADDGTYPLMQVPESLDPELGADPSFVGALFGDLERLGLVGDDSMEQVIDPNPLFEPRTDMVSTLGLQLLAFVAAPAGHETS